MRVYELKVNVKEYLIAVTSLIRFYPYKWHWLYLTNQFLVLLPITSTSSLRWFALPTISNFPLAHLMWK